MSHFAGKVAAITGAGSGIGRALAERLARSGASLALSDIDRTGLCKTADLCARLGSPVDSAQVDVTNRQEVERWARRVVERFGSVHFIFNNAGVALGAEVSSMSFDDFAWIMGINFWGVVNGTVAFLPHLKESGGGCVVNSSSVFGLISIPTQAAYSASKFGVRAYTDSLRMELAIEGSTVGAVTVIPGRVSTNLAKNARAESKVLEIVGSVTSGGSAAGEFSKMSPDAAARRILRAVVRRRRHALIGPDALIVDLLSRMPPVLYETVLILGFRRRNRQLALAALRSEPVAGLQK